MSVSLVDNDGDLSIHDAMVDAMSAAMGAEVAFFSIHRQPNGGKSRMEFVERVDIDKYDWGGLLSYLKDEYGGGDYRIQLHADKVMRKNVLVSIAESKNKKPENSNNESNGFGSLIMAMMQKMDESNRVFMEALQKINNPASVDRKSLLDELKTYKDLFVSQDSGKSQVNNPISSIKETLELFNLLGVKIERGAGAESETSWPDVVAQLGPLLQEVIMTNRQQPGQQHVQQPVQQQAKQRQQNPAGESKLAIQIKMVLGQLLAGAKNKGDPGAFAGVVMALAPREFLQQHIADDAAFEKLEKFDTRISEFKEWFSDLREHVKAQLGLDSKFSDQYVDDENIIDLTDQVDLQDQDNDN